PALQPRERTAGQARPRRGSGGADQHRVPVLARRQPSGNRLGLIVVARTVAAFLRGNRGQDEPRAKSSGEPAERADPPAGPKPWRRLAKVGETAPPELRMRPLDFRQARIDLLEVRIGL